MSLLGWLHCTKHAKLNATTCKLIKLLGAKKNSPAHTAYQQGTEPACAPRWPPSVGRWLPLLVWCLLGMLLLLGAVQSTCPKHELQHQTATLTYAHHIVDELRRYAVFCVELSSARLQTQPQQDSARPSRALHSMSLHHRHHRHFVA